jgi:hypothetical protein
MLVNQVPICLTVKNNNNPKILNTTKDLTFW